MSAHMTDRFFRFILPAFIFLSFYAGCCCVRPPEDGPLDLGSMNTINGSISFILSAPHGRYDINTGELTQQLCDYDLDYKCIIARGYRTSEHPLNVNRPTEGIGLSSSEETVTERAQTVYDEYLRLLQGMGSSKLYVEIHGNSRSESAGSIEVAVVGIDSSTASDIKNLLNQKLSAAGITSVTAAVENIDAIYYTASSAKARGTLSEFSPALHLELPRQLREDNNLPATRQALREFLNGLVQSGWF